MISPKFASTHYYHSARTLASGKSFTPHVINLYLDYNCPFSAKLFLKLKPKVIPKLQELYPNRFQFVFVNVVQPWHTNSNLLHEFSLVVAKLLRESTEKTIDTNKVFWDVSEVLFENKELFYDTANVNLNRNEIYEQIADLVFEKLSLPFTKDNVLKELTIKSEKVKEKQSNSGNGATVDLKYFTRYLRNVGVHVTPTVSINNIVNDSISSGDDIDSLLKTFEAQLD